MKPRSGSSPIGLRLIGGFKVASALLLTALGIGLLRSINSDLSARAHELLAWIKLDPDNRHIHALMEKVAGINPHQLKWIGGGTILYALVYAIEGIGLLLRKPWAEYLTVLLTGLFIPVEIYEVYHKLTAPKLVVLILNVAIVVYLVFVVRNRKRAERASEAGLPTSSPSAVEPQG